MDNISGIYIYMVLYMDYTLYMDISWDLFQGRTFMVPSIRR